MSLLSAIASYLAPATHSARAHRQQNMTCAEANRAAAILLIGEERAYWRAYQLRAKCHGDIEYGQDKLDELDRMEAALND